ncbi:MAG TPA: cyclic nucleotide-binding domain-containing protein [Stellaceae bacterium]|nr:cyclic nucleotide-binding domain-containing protein [Stellaceae bacterium]
MSLIPASLQTSHAAVAMAAREKACQSCAARTLSICGALPTDHLGRLAMMRAPQHLEPGETFLNEGDPATHYLNITAGAVKVYKLLPDGRRQITGFLFAGDLLGLAFNDTYTYSAEALTPVTVCRFPRRQLERLLEEFPAVERRLLAMASNELAAAQEQMVLLGRKTAQERIASFLLTLLRRGQRLGRSAERVKLPMTRADIGDYLGLTTETVSRAFTNLRRCGCIALEGACNVHLLDRDRLEELAEGGE